MSHSGNLQSKQLPELLEWVALNEKTGVLVLSRARVEKTLQFDNGDVVSASSTDPMESLWSLVLRFGLVEEQLLTEVMDELERSEDLLYRYLLRNGHVSEDRINELVRIKTEEIVFELFNWGTGNFVFEEEEQVDEVPGGVRLQISDVQEAARRRIEAWQKIRRFLPDDMSIPVAIGFLDDPAFTTRERALLKMVDDHSTVAELASRCRTTEYEMSLALLSALEKGRLKVVAPERPDPSKSGLALSTGITILDSDSLLSAARNHYQERDFEKALRYMKAAKMLEPNNETVMAACNEMERAIEELVEKAGIHATTVPRLLVSLEELMSLNLSPDAGFLMTRLDGNYSIGEVLKISPISAIDAKLALYRLAQAGHVALDQRH
jgi:hypothetical protein